MNDGPGSLYIIHYPDPRLRKLCEPVTEFDEQLARRVQQMLELMKTGKGVGLAAPQVGLLQRFFVMNPTGQPGDDQVFVNPELSALTGMAEAEEGCLSLPDVHVLRRRAKRCRIRAFDVTGRPIDRTADELLARIWQHETAHLDGGLIIDSMNDTDQIANKKAVLQLETDYRQATKKASSAKTVDCIGTWTFSKTHRKDVPALMPQIIASTGMITKPPSDNRRKGRSCLLWTC